MTDATADPIPLRAEPAAAGGNVRGWLVALLVCAGFLAAAAPGLHRLEFFDGVEHINLATVQELRRNQAEGNPYSWLLMTLEGDPRARVVKPPLTAWLTALLILPSTVEDLSNRDPTARQAAFDRFVRDARWPTIICTALMFLAVYELGRVLGVADGRPGWQVGLVAVIVCASCVLVLRQGRRATTDLQLALWVAVTNAMLARAIVGRGHWLNFIGAGVALGLAQMAKGPHIAILQTVLPVVAFVVWRRWGKRVRRDDLTIAPHLPLMPILLGALISLLIGLCWYAYVWKTVPDVSKIWFHEVTRHDANTAKNRLKADPWYGYVSLLRWFLPWTAWLVLGGGLALRTTWRRGARDAVATQSPEQTAALGSAFALFLLVVPLLVMSCFSEKKERYLTPFAVPAAVLAAQAIVTQWHRRGEQGTDTRPFLSNIASLKIDFGTVAWIVTFVAAAWIAVGVPVQGMLGLKDFRTWDDRPWFSVGLGAGAGILGAGLLIGGAIWIFRRRSQFPALAAVLLATWIGHELLLQGMASSEGNADDRPQRRLAEQIWRAHPDAIVYSSESPTAYGQLSLPSFVLSMYLNRIVATRPVELPTSPGPVPLILLTDRPEATEPLPPPKGWSRMMVIPMRRGTRQVDVLPAAIQRASRGCELNSYPESNPAHASATCSSE